MRNRHEKDILAEAIEQLKKQVAANPLPQEVMDEAVRRIAECGMRNAQAGAERLSLRRPHSAVRIRFGLRFAAAAAFLLVGYVAGRAAAPDVDQLRETLTPAVAASLEPALRERLAGEMRDHYDVALAGTYLRLREELAQQYRDDLNRFAVQMLAASNATTNALLAELVQTIDTAQAQDLRRIASALSQIEAKRIQDKRQLAAGLQTLAYRTEDELSQTKRVLVRLLTSETPQEIELPQQPLKKTFNERNEE
ncbi:MAG: hypothetical protein JW955_03535 [Sedimentisphaerales bacterium]|nr:hypothetical protein [Sedimentisphaerales bacterium]